MVVVAAFGTLANTQHAGLTAYFRATGCTALTIGDVIPLFSKITAYEQEYVIGEMKIWDTGSESSEPNNCAMVRVMVYDDGWICAWFDKETVSQQNTSPAYWIDDRTLDVTTGISYPNCYNGMLVEVTGSNPPDSACPNGTVFCIRNSDFINQTILVHADISGSGYHFNTGHEYNITIRQSNGNLVWWENKVGSATIPTNLSNRLYRAIYEMWEYLKESSNSTDTTDVSISSGRLYRNDGSIYYNYTSEINDDIVNDVPLAMYSQPQPNDAFYYGYNKKFGSLKLNVGIVAAGGTFVWEYWDGSSWQTLSVTDGTSNYTLSGINTVTFIAPLDWKKKYIDGYEAYYIRTRVTVNFSTIPYLTQGWIEEPSSLAYSNSNLGMYSFEDTSANYCLICGIYLSTSHYGTGSTTEDKYFYNTSLLSKIIYSHNISFGFYNRRYYGSSQSKIDINGKQIEYYSPSSNSTYNQPGYVIINIEDIDVNVGSQNVFHTYGYNSGYQTTSSNITKINIAAVLITS